VAAGPCLLRVVHSETPAGLPPWLRGEPGCWSLSVWAVPGAAVTRNVGVHDDCLRIQVAARAVDGRANAALTDWVAQRLKVARTGVQLVSGISSRRKRLVVASPLSADQLRACLLAPDG
jgi:uncharacterized protein